MERRKKPNKITSKKNKKAKKHDQFIKKMFEHPVAARNFLEEYVPKQFLQKVDLSKGIKLEKESYIEESLKMKFSDLVLSLKTKNDKDAIVYVLIEGQSRSDHWMAFRLWRYMLLLIERHIKGKNKIPLVCPVVIYNGPTKYNAPLNLWELFEDPETIKRLWSEDYILVDLEAMKDDEINYQKHHSLMLYLLKHANDRDILKSIENFLKICPWLFEPNENGEYVELRKVLWYITSIASSVEMREIEFLILKELPENQGAGFMKSFLDECLEKGESIGITKGEAIGITKGEAIGEFKTEIRFIKTMLSKGLSIEQVSDLTDVPASKITKMRNDLGTPVKPETV